MASYRNIQLSFWTDAKVADEFTPEDKYFYLYLLTNPHTNTCGCYELSIKQMSVETGYSTDTIDRLIERFALVHDIIRYSKETKEMLVINWYKYNWTTSSKLRTSISNNINAIKHEPFRNYLLKCFNGIDIDSPVEIESIQDIADSIECSEQEDITDTRPKKAKKPQEPKHIYGEYKHVRLTDADYARLIKDYGEEATLQGIKKVDEYCEEYGKKYSNYNLTIRKWGIDITKLNKQQPNDSSGQVRRMLQ